jgi:hypothetical protein
MTEEEEFERPDYGVWFFFPDGTAHNEAEALTGKEAVELAANCIGRPAALAGLIERIIITDRFDFCCFEWIFGRGVTYPPDKPETLQ